MQGGYLSLLYSNSVRPLEYWSKQKSRTGSIRRVIDEELNENVLEIQDVEDFSCKKTWIMCPPETNQILNVQLPFLVIILKNMNMQCHFQLQIVDKDSIKHLINFSNVDQKKNATTKLTPPRMHLFLEQGWNKLEIDLCHVTKLFDVQFAAICRLKICANCRIRRIYFANRHYDDHEMPLGLYHGFLDYYMLKWGIKEVERGTQTKKTTGKPSKDNPALRPAIGFNKLFLKNLQVKSDKIVEEFFSKQSVKSVKDYLDFKRKAKIKPYVISDNIKINKKIKNAESGFMDLSEIKKSFMYDNNLFGKLTFEEKNDQKNNSQDIKNDKQESKYSNYKIHRYKYPEILETKKNIKNDKLSR